MPRLFTALRLPSEIASQLSLKQCGLAGARWIDPDSFHITLSFVGDVDPHAAREIEQALDDTVFAGPLSLTINRLDCFGGDRPRNIFAHVRGDGLEDIKSQSDRALRCAGVDFDRRKYVPHVTLARLKHVHAEDVARYLSESSLTPMTFPVNAVVLLASRDSRGGGPYRTEAEWSLGHESGLDWEDGHADEEDWDQFLGPEPSQYPLC